MYYILQRIHVNDGAEIESERGMDVSNGEPVRAQRCSRFSLPSRIVGTVQKRVGDHVEMIEDFARSRALRRG